MPLTEGAGHTCGQDEKATFDQAAQFHLSFLCGVVPQRSINQNRAFQPGNRFARNDALRLLIVDTGPLELNGAIKPIWPYCADRMPGCG